MQNYIFFGTDQASTAIIVGGVMTENAAEYMSAGVCLRINRILLVVKILLNQSLLLILRVIRTCHHYENRHLYTYTILQEPLHILRFL